MNSKHNNLFVEVLDNGYVVKSGSKRMAIQTSEALIEIINNSLTSITPILNKAGLLNFTISITVDENVPIISDR